MAFRIIQSSNCLPYQGIVDPSAEFQPGMIAEPKVLGNQIVIGVSTGLRPMGIIDDIKTNSFTSNAIDEKKIIPVLNPVKNSNGQLITPTDITQVLDHSNIAVKSFTTNVKVQLIPTNGVVIIPAGTPLNNDMSGTGTPDSIYLRISYTYQIPNMPGADSTAGTGMVTFWFSRIIAETDQFDTNTPYPLMNPLFVNERGLLTTRQITERHPAVAVVWAPPTFHNRYLQFMWL